jgi:hypothetical protein
MKITRIDRQKVSEKIDSMKLPIGTVFTGEISKGYPNMVYLRVFGGTVCLDDPGHTFMDEFRSEVMVKNYEEVDAELIIRRKQ